MNENKLKKIIIQTAALIIFILFIIKIPNFITSLISYFYLTITTADITSPEFTRETERLKEKHFIQLVSASFNVLYLFILSIWLFKTPKIIQKLMKIKEEKS